LHEQFAAQKPGEEVLRVVHRVIFRAIPFQPDVFVGGLPVDLHNGGQRFIPQFRLTDGEQQGVPGGGESVWTLRDGHAEASNAIRTQKKARVSQGEHGL
jgi:hypothetical protein